MKDESTKARIAKANRQRIILSSMESFSVENLQALVILAFDTVHPVYPQHQTFTNVTRLVADVVPHRGQLSGV